MDFDIIEKLYGDEKILNYLRMNPKWYKVLYRDKNSYDEFLKEANIALGNTIVNKFDKFNNQVNFINGIYQYMKNG